MSWIVMTPDAVPFTVSRERFMAAVDAAWPDHWKEMNTTQFTLCSVGLQLDGEPFYTIDLFSDGEAVSTDGTWPQAARTAAWARPLIPAEFTGRVWLMDQGGDGHAELPLGVTPEQVEQGWLDHAIHGYPEDGD